MYTQLIVRKVAMRRTIYLFILGACFLILGVYLGWHFNVQDTSDNSAWVYLYIPALLIAVGWGLLCLSGSDNTYHIKSGRVIDYIPALLIAVGWGLLGLGASDNIYHIKSGRVIDKKILPGRVLTLAHTDWTKPTGEPESFAGEAAARARINGDQPFHPKYVPERREPDRWKLKLQDTKGRYWLDNR